jgi:hypothetical protein
MDGVGGGSMVLAERAGAAGESRCFWESCFAFLRRFVVRILFELNPSSRSGMVKRLDGELANKQS